MKIRLFTILIFSLILCSSFPVLAAEEMTWEQLYGSDLENAPVGLRDEFANSRGKPWHDATYEEREEFLEAKKNQIDQTKQDKTKKEDAAKTQKARLEQIAKDRAAAKKEALKKEEARIKQRNAEKKAGDDKRAAMRKKRESVLRRLKQSQQQHHSN